jgi:hypothetical protein
VSEGSKEKAEGRTQEYSPLPIGGVRFLVRFESDHRTPEIGEGGARRRTHQPPRAGRGGPCGNLALAPLGERVARDGVFISRRGPGLRPPKGYGRSGRTPRYGPQAGEGVASMRPDSRNRPFAIYYSLFTIHNCEGIEP